MNTAHDQGSKPLVSIFISTYKRKGEILRTLKRIYEQSYRPLEVVVVDNASQDGTYEAITEQFKEAICIRVEPENIGLFRAKNLAYRNTSGKYLLSLDDDSFPGKMVIERMVDRFEADPQVGLITFNVYNERSFIQNFEDEAHIPNVPAAHEHYYWSGCGGAYRREIVETFGAWEEWGRVVPYELGIAAKTMKMGLKGMNYSDIYVYHTFGSYDDTEESSSKWAYPTGESIDFRVSSDEATISGARSALLYILKYYPINLITLRWLIKYTWHTSVDTIQRRRITLVKAFFSGFRKTFRIQKERIPLTQLQADRVPMGFNFKGK